jgi:hypothetical protein
VVHLPNLREGSVLELGFLWDVIATSFAFRRHLMHIWLESDPVIIRKYLVPPGIDWCTTWPDARDLGNL